MSISPSKWNVMIIAAWNRAILTPGWIAEHVFNLPKGSPIEIEVPIDTHGPLRIINKPNSVTVGDGFVEIGSSQDDYAGLEQSRKIGIDFLSKLPITPLIAAGFNIRYNIESISQNLSANVNAPLDSWLSTNNYKIGNRKTVRQVVSSNAILGKGVINITLDVSDNARKLELNFHKQSGNKEELIEWLNAPIEDIRAIVQSLLDMITV